MWELFLAILAFFNVAATPTPTPQVNPGERITVNNKTYIVYRQEISYDLRLIPNFEEQNTSTKLMERCTYGANGGFYTQDNKPIGLFISDGILLSRAVSNTTLNGFFVKTDHFALTRQPPTNSVEFALQSGPYITSQSILKIRSDTYSRRILIARSDSRWYFVAITERNNTFSGPLLVELPKLVGELDFDEALNLDGGSASALYSESGVRLGELTPIGSFFCGK